MTLPTIVNIKSDLRPFLNTFNEHIAALKALKFNPDEWSFILLHILLKRIPTEVRSKFELSLTGADIPKYTELIVFLENHCKALEMSVPAKPACIASSKALPVKPQFNRNVKTVMHVQERSKEISCRYCNLDH